MATIKELQEEARDLEIEITGEENASTLKKLIKEKKASEEPHADTTEKPTEDTPVAPEEKEEPAKRGPKKGVTVEFYHRGFGRMEQRTFLDKEAAEAFCGNPDNEWNDAGSGERAKPQIV